MGRTSQETIQAAPQVRARARYYVANDGHAAAGVSALVTYAWGAGAIPAHTLGPAFVDDFWNNCDADGRADFGGLIALAIRAMIVDGEAFVVFRQRPDGLKLQLLPAEQVDESKTADLGSGAYIAAGIEHNAHGERVAYWIRPFLPTHVFETAAPSVRVDAADVLHLMRPEGIGQIRGVSWLAAILIKLSELGLLSTALLTGFRVAALHAGFLIDPNGNAQQPYDGATQNGVMTLEDWGPGAIIRTPAGMDVKFSNPQAAQQSIEFRTSIIEEIAAGLGVPAFMLSANVSRANYSSLRAALITFKAALEALQHNIIVPQLLKPIWRRWVLTDALRNGGAADETDAEWRFPAMPEADPLKQIQAVGEAMRLRIMSRAEAIAARGESVDRVDADLDADRFPPPNDGPRFQTEDEDEDETEDDAD